MKHHHDLLVFLLQILLVSMVYISLPGITMHSFQLCKDYIDLEYPNRSLHSQTAVYKSSNEWVISKSVQTLMTS